jgi:hypothetical protein
MAPPRLRHARALSAPFRGAAIFPSAILFVAAACTAPLHLPPALGNCGGIDGASCTTASGGGGGIELPIEAGAPAEDAGLPLSQGVEGGSCGMADTLIASPCAPCIVASCCQADSDCSSDDGCLSLVNCVVNGAPCPSLSVSSTTAFGDLAQCYTLNCPAQCLTLEKRDF